MSKKGTLKKFFQEKGIGYIAPDDGSDDVFIHFQAVLNGGESDMIPGAKLSYDLEVNDRNGKTKAVRVKIESPGDPNATFKGGKGGYGKASEASKLQAAGPYGAMDQLAQAYGMANLAAGYDMSAAYWAAAYAQATQAAQAAQVAQATQAAQVQAAALGAAGIAAGGVSTGPGIPQMQVPGTQVPGAALPASSACAGLPQVPAVTGFENFAAFQSFQVPGVADPLAAAAATAPAAVAPAPVLPDAGVPAMPQPGA
eukprot:TRINITY_DN4582_c0_g1_i1.p1 TRINITY_DN4582_c0_g1~~TRINITY_DN4582_c0_g1_i1.p1  ORF type:complete len:255 (+),score=64.24 TRINITY_DN4582_c0_g1_i1:90-854(+)